MNLKKNKIMPDFVWRTDRRVRFHYITALNLLSGLGMDINKIFLRSIGIHENYKGEVRSQIPEPGTPLTDETQITLEIGNLSAVDFMPYQFFYGLQGLRDTDNSWEESARSLMAPFDAAVARRHADAGFFALKYEMGVVDEEHLGRVLNLFDFDFSADTFRLEEILLWASILPSLYLWGGNAEVMTNVLGRLFPYKFGIVENVPESCPIPSELYFKLGSKTSRLGSETIIGKSFVELDSTYELTVSGVPAGHVADLLPNGKIRRRIEKLLDYCMPGELDRRIKIKVDEDSVRTPTNNYLGYSSYL